MERNSGGGIGFTSLLTLLFIGLKLTGFIDWSWWWVLSPVWVTLVLAVTFIICAWLWLQFEHRWFKKR